MTAADLPAPTPADGTKPKRKRVRKPSEWRKPVDGRGRLAQRVRALTAEMVRDKGGAVNAADLGLIGRLAFALAEVETIEAGLLRGGRTDMGLLARRTNSIVRLRAALGLDRQANAKPAPTMRERIIAERAGGA